MDASPTWPPTNLSQWSNDDLNALVDACQMEEIALYSNMNLAGSSSRQSSFWFALVQLLALLRLGDYGHARHVYRRWKDRNSNSNSSNSNSLSTPWTEEECNLFESWFRVGQAMMTDQLDVVWIGLWDMMQTQQPEPLKTYAQEVADAYYQQRMLPVLKRRWTATTTTNKSNPLQLGRQVPSLALYLQTYQGWKCEGSVWTPPPHITLTSPTTATQQRQPLSLNKSASGTTTTSSSNKELLHLIAFLENPQLQA